MSPESLLLAISVVLVLVGAGAWVWKRRRDAARRRIRVMDARAWALGRIEDLEARNFEPLPGPDANDDPGLAALRERFVQSIEDGDENPDFWKPLR